MEEARSVWEGRVGDTMLTVQVHPSGRIAAQWRGKTGNERRVVVNTIGELERSVLFQLMLWRCRQFSGGEPGSAMQWFADGFEATVIFEDTNQSRSTFLFFIEHTKCGGD